ncbi:hypothetical protein ACFOWE_09250 [Planomonospora corallina]|uniref:FG-GAP repeat-containing protein n=1 Tax=Planomonospora corallina TaxID=1806052 RepID=A0ABV8I6D3_9ACTN
MRLLAVLLAALALPPLAAPAAPPAAVISVRPAAVMPAAPVPAYSTGSSSPSSASSSAPAACSGTGPGAGAAGGDFDGDGMDDVVAGDPLADTAGAGGSGAVHVLPGTSGQAGAPVVVSAPAPAAGDGFGWTVRLVHLDGDRCADLLVGAPYADVAGVRDAGAVYAVYGGGRREAVPLVAAEPEAGAHFGWSLAVRGPLIAVGAPHEDVDGVRDSGAVHLFEAGKYHAGRRLTQNTEGVTGNSETGDLFGWALELGRLGGDAGELDLAVGQPYENDDGQGTQSGGGTADSGSLTVLFDVRARRGEQATRKWDLRDLTDARTGDRFGYALAYTEQGDTAYLAVGAPLGDGGAVEDSGLVQLFQAASTAEVTPAYLLHQGALGASGEGYGSALAFAGGGDVRLAVGTPFDGQDRRGSVRLVPLADRDRAQPVEGPSPGARFGWSVAASGNKLVAGAPDHGPSGAVALLGRNDGAVTLLSPGTGRIPAVTGGASVDFGAATG